MTDILKDKIAKCSLTPDEKRALLKELLSLTKDQINDPTAENINSYVYWPKSKYIVNEAWIEEERERWLAIHRKVEGLI